MRLAAALLLLATPAAADTLSLPPAPHDRAGAMAATFRSDRAAAGRLEASWTDALGRRVQQDNLHVAGGVATIVLDLGRAATMRNRLAVRFTPDDGAAPADLDAVFAVRPADAGWHDNEIIMWQEQDAAGYAALRRQGVSAAMLYGKSGVIDPPALDALLDGGMRFYVENIATDFFAPYHLASSNALFEAAKALHARDPMGTSAFRRQPSLSDPAWRDRVGARLGGVVDRMRYYRPLYYSLADEAGIADLAAAWDFDLSEPSLAGFRAWLAARYASLERLNAQWGTSFARWEDVTPRLTDAAVAQPDENFAAWADFKDWMDEAFAGAVRAGTQAVHDADPSARAALEGAQVPGWGGWNYARLAGAVDVMEIYDHGANVEIAGALDPNLVVLTTTAIDSPAETNRIWHEILLGARGQVLWDETGATRTAPAAARLFAGLRGGLPAQLIAMAPQRDPVAILYSQASFRLTWLLARRGEHSDWARRRAETEDGDENPWRSAMADAVDTLAHAGRRARWLTPETLQAGGLAGVKLLVLPHTLALSDAEADAIRAFAAAGGVVIADDSVGRFDAHGSKRATPALAGLAGAIVPPARLAEAVGAAVPPGPRLTRADGTPATDVQLRRYQAGGATLLALQRDPAARDTAETVLVSWPGEKEVADPSDGAAPTRATRVTRALGPSLPVFVALADAPWPRLSLERPADALRGQTATLRLTLDHASPAPESIVHVEVAGPDGAVLPAYSGNFALHGTEGRWAVPLALNDAQGAWTIRARFVLTGQTVAAPLTVR